MFLQTRPKHDLPPDSSMKYLHTVANEVEMSLVRGLLDGENIPFYSKDRDSSSYLRIFTGSSIYGTDIFVQEEDFDKANELLQGYFSSNTEEEADAETDEAQTEEPAADQNESNSETPDEGLHLSTRTVVILLIVAILALVAVKVFLGGRS